VVTAEGRSDWRLVDAPDQQGAIAQVLADGLTPLDVRHGSPSLIDLLNQPVHLGGRLRLAEQSLLLSQLAMLIRAGLPIDRSLDLIREQSTRAAQRDILARAVTRIRGGGSLASAFEEMESFPSYVVGVIRAAERGGKLGQAMTSLAERLSTAASTRRQLVTALTYPAAVFAATLIALILVLTSVVPQFEPVFEGEEDRLPSLTRGVLALSDLTSTHGPALIVAVVGTIAGLWFFFKSTAGSQFISRHHRRVPGLALRDQYLAAQFTGVLGTLIANGVTAVAALPLARGAIGSRRWQAHIAEVERRVREGARLSAALDEGGLLPSTAVRLIEVGERSGKLADTCTQASSIIAEAARARLDRIVSLANPIAIVLLGGIVAMLVAGVMLGIFALGDFAG
jgi:type II secretory pathway component PulF